MEPGQKYSKYGITTTTYVGQMKERLRRNSQSLCVQLTQSDCAAIADLLDYMEQLLLSSEANSKSATKAQKGSTRRKGNKKNR